MESPNTLISSFTMLAVILVVSASIDLSRQKIPNFITLPGILLGLGFHGAASGVDGLLFSGGGLLLGIGLFMVPYLLGGMGAGDAKLMGTVGAFLGASGVFHAFIYTAIAGGIYALILFAFHRRQFKGFFRAQYETLVAFVATRRFVPDSPESAKKLPRLCYGLAIALGTGFFMLTQIGGGWIGLI